MKKEVTILIVFIAVIIIGYLGYKFYFEAYQNCVSEGGSVGVNPNMPGCCRGLKTIMNKEESENRANPKNLINTGGIYICTDKCGNGICDQATENIYNCPEDC